MCARKKEKTKPRKASYKVHNVSECLTLHFGRFSAVKMQTVVTYGASKADRTHARERIFEELETTLLETCWNCGPQHLQPLKSFLAISEK
jgi:hypothetical protein